VGDEQLGEGYPALLAGGEITEGKVSDSRKTDRFGGVLDGEAGSAACVTEKDTPEIEIFCNRKFILHRVSMAKVVADLARMATSRAPFVVKYDSAFFRPQQSGGHTQQSGLSRSISTREDKRLAGRQVKGNVNENEILTAPCSQIFGGEMHASALSRFRLPAGSKNVRF
jgi:hypothetical protein